MDEKNEDLQTMECSTLVLIILAILGLILHELIGGPYK